MPPELLKPQFAGPNGQKIPENTLFCHLKGIPTNWLEQDNAALPPKMKQSYGWVPCATDKCMLWNSAKKECWDVSKARAITRLAELKDDEVIGSEH
jgi:hypothetical protein